MNLWWKQTTTMKEQALVIDQIKLDIVGRLLEADIEKKRNDRLTLLRRYSSFTK